MNDRYGPYLKILRPLAWVVAVLILIYLLLLRSVFHSFNCDPVALSSSYQVTNGFAKDNQVIVYGTRKDIETLITTPAASVPTITPTGSTTPETPVATVTPVGSVTTTPGILATPTAPTTTPVPGTTSGKITLNLIEDCDLSYLNTRDNPNPSLTKDQRTSLVMQLYEIPTNLPTSQGLTVEGVISRINAARGDNLQKPNYYVFADPNYLVSLLELSSNACGLPNSDGGSGGGKDFGDPGELNMDLSTAKDAFSRQWAFGNKGINLPASSQFTGRGVRVAVFDTSPLRVPFPFFRRIGISMPTPFWLKVRDTPGAATVMSNHGLFVAGIIHKVAPNSKIQIVRVLNDNGCSEIWNIDKALQDYISRTTFWTGDMNKVVINMSLGVIKPTQAQIKADPTLKQLDQDIDSLSLTIADATGKGAFIVAAAGNDSYPTDPPSGTNRQEMEFPASDPKVLGVAATNKNGDLSCYSNKGEFMAPGGDGGKEPPPAKPGHNLQPCVPRTDTWDKAPGPIGSLSPCSGRDPANCPFGLISLAQNARGEQTYMFWSGTSFAAPLVSGLAALAYEKTDRAGVECLILNGSSLKHAGRPQPDAEKGWGMVNFTTSLTDTAVLSTCRVSP